MFKVTNTNTQGLAVDFVARYDGKEYFFPSPKDGKKQPVYIDDDAATHIFGIGKFDKKFVLVRHGWSTFANTEAAGMDILNKFIFEQPEIAYDAPMALELSPDHGPAPVVQDAPGSAAPSDEPGVVADAAAAPRKAAR
jgi:hypothetical protein